MISLPPDVLEELDRVVFWSKKKHRSKVVVEALKDHFRTFRLLHFNGKETPPVPGLE